MYDTEPEATSGSYPEVPDAIEGGRRKIILACMLSQVYGDRRYRMNDNQQQHLKSFHEGGHLGPMVLKMTHLFFFTLTNG